MPGSDEQYDLVRVKDASSNSKADTFFVAPKHVGRDGAGTERVVLKEVGEPPTPPAGNQYLFLATDGLLKAKFADGTVTAIGGESGAPDDAEYVTLSPNGDLSAESLHQDLTGAELHDPAIHSGSHAEGGADPVDVDSLVNADLKADLTAPDGTVLSSQIPDLAVTETFTVPDQAGRLALTDVQEGDVALQTDTDEGYIFTGGDPSLDANWSLLSNFDPPVDSVFGRVGDIVAQAGDYAASQISNFSSAVLNTIDGASITPNDVTATDVNTDSVNTDRTQTGEDAPAGTTQVALRQPLDGIANKVQTRTQKTENVSTTEKAILTVGGLDGFVSVKTGRAVVMGSDLTDAATTFSDIITFTRAGAVTVAAESNRGSTDARTYSIDAAKLSLTMAADNYKITVIADGAT